MRNACLLVLACGLAAALIAGAPAPGTSGGTPGSASKKSPPVLKAGMPAPAINPDKWVKGAPVSSYAPGHVYVVEFWATWCPPCRKSIPHLTELQKKFKDDVTIIGVDGFERSDPKGKDTRLSTVEKFVKDMGDKMDYSVAFETDGEMSKSWMEAARQDGIPYAFIVGGDGKLTWTGYPMDGDFEKQIEAAVKAAKPARTKSPAETSKTPETPKATPQPVTTTPATPKTPGSGDH